jgi:hypothetical protein
LSEPRKLLFTLDTGVVEHQQLRAAIDLAGVDAAVVTVSDRELAGSSFEVHLQGLIQIDEPAVWGEGVWGRGTWGGGVGITYIDRNGASVTDHPLEELLFVISAGSFPVPGRRELLSKGQRHQLRDAMILTAHLQHGRDVFVTGDSKAFIKNERRSVLQERFGCRILTPTEAVDFLRTLS